MFAEDASAQSVVELNDNILRTCGMSPSKDWAILDYGCGAGRHVYEYLDRGYAHVQGYDIGDFVVPRQATDVARFRFGSIDGDGHMSPLPWPSDSFDFVFATSVFEHVRDQATAYAEINRVLKPGGVFLNMFPSKWRPLEPHTHIPSGERPRRSGGSTCGPCLGCVAANSVVTWAGWSELASTATLR